MDRVMKLYAVRDKSTGRFLSEITNPRHKFWEKKGCCEQAVRSYNPDRKSSRRGTVHNKEDLEVVELTFAEEGTDGRNTARFESCNNNAGYKCSNCKARISNAAFFNGNHNFCYKCGVKIRRR